MNSGKKRGTKAESTSQDLKRRTVASTLHPHDLFQDYFNAVSGRGGQARRRTIIHDPTVAAGRIFTITNVMERLKFGSLAPGQFQTRYSPQRIVGWISFCHFPPFFFFFLVSWSWVSITPRPTSHLGDRFLLSVPTGSRKRSRRWLDWQLGDPPYGSAFSVRSPFRSAWSLWGPGGDEWACRNSGKKKGSKGCPK